MNGKKIKVCKDWENATLVLYHNICNIWHKNVIQVSYKDHNSQYAFISCHSYTIRIQLFQLQF